MERQLFSHAFDSLIEGDHLVFMKYYLKLLILYPVVGTQQMFGCNHAKLFMSYKYSTNYSVIQGIYLTLININLYSAGENKIKNPTATTKTLNQLRIFFNVVYF